MNMLNLKMNFLDLNFNIRLFYLIYSKAWNNIIQIII